MAYNGNFTSCEVISVKDSYYDIVNNKSRSDWILLIDEWVHNEVDRQLLKRKLLDGISL